MYSKEIVFKSLKMGFNFIHDKMLKYTFQKVLNFNNVNLLSLHNKSVAFVFFMLFNVLKISDMLGF